MKYGVYLITAGLFFASCSGKMEQSSDNSQLVDDVSYLAGDALEGRETGTKGEEMAASYIAQRFEDLGLEAKGDSGWYQKFTFTPHPPMQMHGQGDTASLGMAIVKEVSGMNVIGYMDNGQENTVVIGAHYDHLGWGGESSLHAGDSAIHNGADDNASGVGALMMLIERLKTKHKGNNYLFMAFSGEEKGLWGSNHFCDEPTIDLASVNYMLNMDMVGRLNEERTLAVYGVGTSPSWTPMLEGLSVDSITITTTESGVGPSDHTSFYLEDLPVLHFFTGQHEDYHKPTDDIEKINWEGIVSVVNYMEAVIAGVEPQGKLEFTKTKDEVNESTPSFNVTLGVMPDYMYGGQGMRIDGVTEDRPAHKAGLEKGDIVIAMGDSTVTDMHSYMRCLGAFEPGDTTLVTVLRDSVEVGKDVIWD